VNVRSRAVWCGEIFTAPTTEKIGVAQKREGDAEMPSKNSLSEAHLEDRECQPLAQNGGRGGREHI